MTRRRRTQIGGQFAPRLIEMLESPAYRVLSLSARRVIDRIEIELAHHGGTDNGKLPVTYNDFEKYGIERHAIGPAIREAAALGFVEVTEPGRAGNAEWRKPTLYRLTFRHAEGIPGDGSHEWRRLPDLAAAQWAAKSARKPPPQKNIFPVGEKPNSRWGNPHRKCKFQGGFSHTTGQGGFSHTTLDISGEGHHNTSPNSANKKNKPNKPDHSPHRSGERQRTAGGKGMGQNENRNSHGRAQE